MKRFVPLILILALGPAALAQDDLEEERPITDLALGDDIGALELEPPTGSTTAPANTSFPAPPQRSPVLLPRFDLSGEWRVEGVDAEAGKFAGTIKFRRIDSARFTYERRVAPAGQVLARAAREEGEARIIGGRLYLRSSPPRSSLGLENSLGQSGLDLGRGQQRQAVLKLDDDAQRFEGLYKVGPRRGVERLRRGGWQASDNRVALLVDGDQAFPAFRRALGSARRSIELQTFIYTDDPTGRSITALLLEKLRAGVKVRVLVDAVGAKMGDMDDQLRAAGAEVIIQHGYLEGLGNSIADVGRGVWNAVKRLFGGAPPADREKRGIFNHDHRKIIVVDGRVAFCGGMNMADEYEHEWHDVHAQIEGSAVPRLRSLFYDRWHAAGGKGEPPEALPCESPAGDMNVDVVASLPGISHDIKARYLKEIEKAQTRVLIENAYFLDDDTIDAMHAASRRGVRALLVIPGDEHHDVKLVRDAFNYVQNDVIRGGIELYKYDGRMVHAKVASWDGRVATVGSSNLDNMALARLAEANLFVNDRRFALDLEQRIFVVDLPRSTRCSENELSFWNQLKGSTLHLIRSFL